jgi:quercetin dioxygenase-like cupin family protein
MPRRTKKTEAASPVGRPVNLQALVDYQDGAIVSRTLVDKDTGTVTAFAFDAGEALSEHTAPFDALAHVFDGRAEFRISGRRFPVGAGEMIIMPANKPHAVKAVSRFKMLLVMIR